MNTLIKIPEGEKAAIHSMLKGLFMSLTGSEAKSERLANNLLRVNLPVDLMEYDITKVVVSFQTRGPDVLVWGQVVTEYKVKGIPIRRTVTGTVEASPKILAEETRKLLEASTCGIIEFGASEDKEPQ